MKYEIRTKKIRKAIRYNQKTGSFKKKRFIWKV